MFGKKKTPVQGRQRPQVAPEQRRGSAVFSYHAANTRSVRPGTGNAARDLQAQQKEIQKGPAAERRRKRINWLKRGPATAALVLAAILLLYSLFLDTQPQLVQVQEGDTRGTILLRGKEVYTQAAAGILGGSVRNRTKLTINTGDVAKKMSSQFPELGQVTVTLPVFGHQPIVHIQAAMPALILSTASGQSYVVDTSGRALISPTQASGVSKLGLPVVTDQSGLEIVLGHIALPASTTRFITEVAGQLQAAHLSISSLTLPKGTSELDVRLNGVRYFTKYNVRGDARAEAGTFLAVKQKLDSDHKTPGEYVDVRVDGRAYYR